MQITHARVVPVELDLRLPFRTAVHAEAVDRITCIFVCLETREGRVAWGCAAFDPAITGETIDQVTRACQACADRSLDLNPLNTEFALAELHSLTQATPSARCAFDIAFHDLLGLAAGLPVVQAPGQLPAPHPDLGDCQHRARERDR